MESQKQYLSPLKHFRAEVKVKKDGHVLVKRLLIHTMENNSIGKIDRKCRFFIQTDKFELSVNKLVDLHNFLSELTEKVGTKQINLT